MCCFDLTTNFKLDRPPKRCVYVAYMWYKSVEPSLMENNLANAVRGQSTLLRSMLSLLYVQQTRSLMLSAVRVTVTVQVWISNIYTLR